VEIGGRDRPTECGIICPDSLMIYRFEDCELDLGVFELRRGGEAQKIEPQVFDVLAYLVRHHDRVVPKRELLDQIWDDRFVSESALTSRLKAARRVVGDDGRAQRIIRTVHGRGYRVVVEVEQIGGPAELSSAPTDVGASAPVAGRARPETITRYAATGRYSTAYQVVGGGDADVVFIPGFVSNIELQWELPGFSDFFERLASHYRLIVFDKRGTGLSDRIPPDEVPTLEERMEDVLVVMDAVGSKRATIFGISEGAPMAVLLAATHPERVRQLVLFSAYARMDWMSSEELETRLVAMSAAWGEGQMYADFLAPSWGKDPTMRKHCARYERHAATPATAAQILRLSAQGDITGVLGSVKQPTLVLHRHGDRLVPLSAAEALADGIPGSRMIVLEGEDHLAFAGDADTLLAHAEDFISGAAESAVEGERVLATVVFASIDDSAAQAKDLGDRGWRDVLREYHRAATDVAKRHHGRVAKTDDDTVLLRFSGPARAVRCACALRDEVEPTGMRLRVGIHTAEVEVSGAQVAGTGVDIGASVAALASPGEVWVSRTVRDLVVGSGLGFSERGTHELPGAGESWELYAVDASGD